jgi:hypothetical protein
MLSGERRYAGTQNFQHKWLAQEAVTSYRLRNLLSRPQRGMRKSGYRFFARIPRYNTRIDHVYEFGSI